MSPWHTFISLAFLQLWSSWLPVLAQTPQTFFPPTVPLAVRSPTFNCWLDVHNGTNPMSTWPTFWNDQHILGWAGYIKVDGLAWHWLGDPVPGNASTWISTAVTPTRTILTVQAGPMLLNVTFLSPVEPSDWVLQSFPFSYVYVDGQATDGQAHSIQLYSDISAEWVTNSLTTPVQWSTTAGNNSVYHQVQSSSPTSVFQDVAEDSVAYHAIASNQPGLVSVIGNDQTLRPQFSTLTPGFTLTSDLPTTFGTVRDASTGKFPVFAHALDLGQTATISSVAWVVGLVRDPVVTASGVPRRAYFWSQYPTISDAIDAFVSDFADARARAIALDEKILRDASSAVSDAYGDLVSLAARQAVAGVEITLSTTSAGEFNFSDVQAFMKDVGNSQRVNPTEVIYAAMPALIYLNSSITGALLEPLLQFQASSSYPNSYAAPDLGLSYPAAPGNTVDEAIFGIENSGNMLILALAHARTSGDGSLISKYYNLLKKWGDYLVANALTPGLQESADARDAILAQNQVNITNLAIKGIIAIQAMSEISLLLGETADAQTYQSAATNFTQSWLELASSSGHVVWTYGNASSYGLMYNLLADRLLHLNVVPSSLYAAESSALQNVAQGPYGLPLSSYSNSNARSDWALFSAAAVPDTTTQNLLITGVHKRASLNTTAGVFSTLYNVDTGAGTVAGTYPNGFASPAQGAMFSILALNVSNQTVILPAQAPVSGASGPASSPKPRTNSGAIAGGTIAGVFVLLIVAGLGIFLRRRRQQRGTIDLLEAPRPYHGQPTPASGPATMSEVTSPTSDGPGVAPSHMHTSNTTRYHFPTPISKPPIPTAADSRMVEPFSPVTPPTSQAASVSGTRSTTSRGTADLMSEMENLRREVEQLRAERVPQDAPPMYQ
ncbi:hypothetical protein DFH07DRAFT_951896 [Mycena maculata]|uniref:DUF1793-domain-containing protein n=1 Tax=Mycena maculata TaxID=230809 RepID=A0AAD7K124_9AGAR|nr:hypothetical protein DFH07DRAFT_951896 [Mycena maculata]